MGTDVTKREIKRIEMAVAVAVLGLIGGCGGGGGDAVTPPPIARAPVLPAPVPVVQYAVGGTVTGLGPGASLKLTNGGETMSVTADGPFAFAMKLPSGAAFSISAAAPQGYTCKVSDPAGVLAGADARQTAVSCAPVVLAGVVRALQQPAGLASDGAGNLYLADAGNHSVLKLSTSGEWSVMAGGAMRPGYVDGPGAAARFWFTNATDIVVDGQGNLLVSDACNRVVRKLTPAGAASTLAGKEYPCTNVQTEDWLDSRDGSGRDAVFQYPGRMVADGAGGALMVESPNNGSVRKISATGEVGSLRYPPVMIRGSFDTPSFKAIARTAGGTLYLADTENRIWKDVDGALVLVAGGQAGSGSIDGAGAAARFAVIVDMVAAPDGNLYVADMYTVRKVTPAGLVSTLAGSSGLRGHVDEQGTAARFGTISQLVLDPAGLALLDSEQGTLRRVSYDGKVTTLAATPAVRGRVDGAGSNARIASYSSLGADADGNLYVAESSSHVVRKVTAAGVVSTVAGQVSVAGRTDGPVASATLTAPTAVAAGRDGSLWVLQQTGLRRIMNGTVTTVNATIRGASLAIDAQGNAIVGTGYNANSVVRVTPAGELTTLITKEDVMALSGDPNNWFSPMSVAVDSAGNVYAADFATVVVYKLDKSGKLGVFAGTLLKETGDRDGPAGTATLGFYDLDYLTIDDAGNLYLSGQGGVRVISPAGVVSTPVFAWGQAKIGAVAYAKGKLYGATPYALLQTYLP